MNNTLNKRISRAAPENRRKQLGLQIQGLLDRLSRYEKEFNDLGAQMGAKPTHWKVERSEQYVPPVPSRTVAAANGKAKPAVKTAQTDYGKMPREWSEGRIESYRTYRDWLDEGHELEGEDAEHWVSMLAEWEAAQLVASP